MNAMARPGSPSATRDDVALNPSSIHMTRSLSKSTTRDVAAKGPPPPRAQVIDRAEDDISVQPPAQSDALAFAGNSDDHPWLPSRQGNESPVEQLPTEILEAILDHVGGQLGSPAARRSADGQRNWNALLRHPRRKNISDLALVSPTWRHLVQQRIFRHIKIQGTQAALTQCGDFFLNNPHLQPHVRHLQVIVPIWETKSDSTFQRQLNVDPAILDSHSPVVRGPFAGQLTPDHAEISHLFQPASHNASLSEIFASAQVLFPDLHALSIEGGHCKRPPQIHFFPLTRPPTPLLPYSLASYMRAPLYRYHYRNSLQVLPGPSLPTILSLRVFILKGAWNIVRTPAELALLHRAMPNLQELHCVYHAPKTNAYTTMCASLRPDVFPRTLRHLNVCLEGLYNRSPASLTKWRKVYPFHHICRDLGCVMPQLESLTYTGRLCGAMFSTAIKAAENIRPGATRLKRIDIIVQNVCRDINTHNDATGITNWPFIQAFELLVLQAMRALEVYTNVHYLRIRYIDLDSADPLLNPAFHMEANRAWGLWSPDILHLLNVARPSVEFEGARFGDSVDCMNVDENSGLCLPSGKSHSMEYYRGLLHGLGRAPGFGL